MCVSVENVGGTLRAGLGLGVEVDVAVGVKVGMGLGVCVGVAVGAGVSGSSVGVCSILTAKVPLAFAESGKGRMIQGWGGLRHPHKAGHRLIAAF